MSRKNEIDCLIKLNNKVNCFADMIDFLSNEKIISRNEVAGLVNAQKLELPYELHRILKHALKEELLQLLDYQWEILPQEKIRVSIITKQTHKDFAWNF